MAFVEPYQSVAPGMTDIMGADWMKAEHSTGVSYFLIILHLKSSFVVSMTMQTIFNFFLSFAL